MSEVFDIVSRAGRIPLSELVLRSSQPPEALTEELLRLRQQGLVEVNGDIPTDKAALENARSVLVALTNKGFSVVKL